MNHISPTDQKMETKQLLLSLPDKGSQNQMFNTQKHKIMNIIGRLTKDATVKTLDSQKQVVNFSIATDQSYKNRKGDRVTQTTYFDCSYWISTAVAQYLTKGKLVELSGSVSARAWVNQAGEPKASLNFHTSTIKLHSGSNNEATSREAAAPNPVHTSVQHEDLPF